MLASPLQVSSSSVCAITFRAFCAYAESAKKLLLRGKVMHVNTA